MAEAVGYGGEIRAAGAVLWRPAGRGIEVALIHRPRYDDWSFPKGKLKPGEHVLLAAVREVAEETGLQPDPGPAAAYGALRVRRAAQAGRLLGRAPGSGRRRLVPAQR